MRIISTLLAAGSSLAMPAFAQEFTPQCQAIYDAILAENPNDFRACTFEVAPYELEDCQPPAAFNATRPTSHLILAIDASGSMAGQVGGSTKMEIAKAEALTFLQEIPTEVEVGLVVYGHRGNNQDDGKAESCAASELVHDFGTSRANLTESIGALNPTGWTPLGGVLEYAGNIIAELDPPQEGDLAPVIYLLSDGEETCDGDPVAAATALFAAGVQTTVNTIGFDVDAETAAQLEAIAVAAGGVYYPADNAQSLRSQLNAIRDAEVAAANYQLCVDLNVGKIASTYHNARLDLVGCYQRNNPQRAQVDIINAMNRAVRDNTPDAICKEELVNHALNEMDVGGSWLSEQTDPLTSEPLRLIEEYRASEGLGLLQAN